MQTRRVQLAFKPESGFDYALNTLQSIGLPIRDRTTEARPHSAQAKLSVAPQQALREPASVIRGPHPSKRSSAQPSRPSLPPANSLFLPGVTSQYGPNASGVDRNDASKHLLAAMSRAGPGDGGCQDSGLTEEFVASSTDLLRQHDLASDFRQVGTHVADSLGFDWQSNPYGMSPIRPTTAPVTKSERRAPETISLSQMLPPDRVLPFPTKGQARSRPLPTTSKSSQCRPKSSSSDSTVGKPGTIRPHLSEATPIRDDGQNSRDSSDASGPSTLITPYNLRPGSSSSSLELSASIVSATSAAAPCSKASTRNKILQKRANLGQSNWRMSEAEFLQMFTPEAFESTTFLDELVKFAKIEKNFTAAYDLMKAAQRERQDRLNVSKVNGPPVREWTSNDIRNAIAAHHRNGLEAPTTNVRTAQANTPKKRVRDTLVGREVTNDQPQQPVIELARSTTKDASPSTPNFSPVTPSQSRKRPASVLEDIPGNGQVRPRSPGSSSTIVAVEHPVSAATNLEVPPVDTAPVPTTGNQQYPTAAEETQIAPDIPLPEAAVNVQQLSATSEATAATSHLKILPTELTSLLEDWAKNSHYLHRPAPAPSSAPTPAPPNPNPTHHHHHQTPKQSLAAFMAQDQQTRIKSLDEQIRACINDENFVKLAEDVEGSWMCMDVNVNVNVHAAEEGSGP